MSIETTRVRYPLLHIDIQKFKSNLAVLSAAVKRAGCSLMIVTKSFCADEEIVRMLVAFPLVDYLADSRIQNLTICAGWGKPTVLLWLPQPCEIEDVSIRETSGRASVLRKIKKFSKRRNERALAPNEPIGSEGS